MVRNMEKLVKIECSKEISDRNLNTIKPFTGIPILDLMDIEPLTESGAPVHVDLSLDQLEEQEE